MPPEAVPRERARPSPDGTGAAGPEQLRAGRHRRAAGIRRRGGAREGIAICGITTNHCCETSARVGGNLGHDVLYALDATHTFDRTGPDGTVVTADDLARATAANLHGEFATVVGTAQLLGLIATRVPVTGRRPEYLGAMRFGLVGTGPWATMAHGPGLLASRTAELVGIWGRSLDKAESFARSLGVTAYEDYAALLADVDAVALAVPPDVQAEMAVTAARAGKHLLLDKPVALTAEAARGVRDAAAEAGVASVVFFTDRFIEASRAWFAQVQVTGGWRGGWLRWFSALQQEDNPFGASAWRRQRGALWDTGPHALSTLGAALGPITSLTPVAGDGDLITLVLRHQSGAMSVASLSQFAPAAAAGFDAAVWGDVGLLPMPLRPDDDDVLSQAYATAADELVAAAESGRPHPVDVAFGTRIVELLAGAEATIVDAQGAS